ncbi:uncharacterized protein LOC115663843 isoform X2 [Syzygium oleosum]|nr:uncharacterized protein LOC115663843 isoform X2 [Syzygium oleosum]
MVWHAEGSAQEQMHIPGKMVELLALFKTSPGLEEDHEAGEQAAAPATGSAAVAAAAAAYPAEYVGELEFQQQHVAVEGGGRGGVEFGSVHFQGQGGGDREEEDGGPYPLSLGSDQGRDRTHDHYSQEKRQRR